MRTWFHYLRRMAPKSNPRRRQRAMPPSLERLEERCLLAVNTTTHVAGPNIDVSNLPGTQSETTIAINPTNPLNMIAGSNNLGGGGFTEAYWTKDGGATWHAINLGQNGDPGIAFDRAGNAYFSYIDNALNIGVKESTDGGVTWGHNVIVGHNHGLGIQDKPAIAIGPDALNPSRDRIYFAWDDNSAGDIVKVSSSGDGGVTWTAPKKVDALQAEFFTAPAVGPQGQFYLAWTNFGTAGQSTIMFASSLDDGTTFTTPIVAATSTINTFNPTQYTIPAQPSRGISPNPGLAVEQSGSHAGRIYLVYDTAVAGQHNNTNVELIASDDGGATWTALAANPVKVNDDKGKASQFFPAMAIDPSNGTVDIAWYDTRNDPTNKMVDVYFQDFSSAGVRNGANVKVTTAMSDESNPSTNSFDQFGDYIGIAATGGLAFPVWTDHRNDVRGGEEIFVDPPLPLAGGRSGGVAAPSLAGADTDPAAALVTLLADDGLLESAPVRQRAPESANPPGGAAISPTARGVGPRTQAREVSVASGTRAARRRPASDGQVAWGLTPADVDAFFAGMALAGSE
jgi:hypothetical protein